MKRATQDVYITHRSIHEKIIMHQPSWSLASSVNQPFWLWSYEHGKNYARWLHHTPINTQKDYHASTFMIIRVKLIPTILALELITRQELHKMVTSHTDQYTKRLSCINLHDHTNKAKPNQFGVGVINMERATQDVYITHRSIHEKIIWRWSYQHGKSYASMLTSHTIDTRFGVMSDHHASTFIIIRIKLNPTILALELWACKELHKMVTSHTDQNTKKLSCINLHDCTHQA